MALKSRGVAPKCSEGQDGLPVGGSSAAMGHMNTSVTLLLLLLCLHLFYAAAWWLAGTRLGLQRAAVLHWAGYCICLVLGASAFASVGHLPAPWPALLGNLLVVSACILVRRGLACFGRYPLHNVENLVLLALTFALMAILGGDDTQITARAVLISAVLAYLLLRMGLEMVAAIRAEFGAATGWMLAGPVLLLALALMVRAVLALWHADEPDRARLTADATAGVGVLFILTVASTLFQLSLVYLVILRLVRKLRQLSHHDALTGLLNRRAWERALALARHQLRRKPTDVALLVIDIDHFKRLNDQHGHAAGDLALVAVADALRQVARVTDAVARLGGEEFGVLLPDTSSEGALIAAERVREAVAGLRVPHAQTALQMTVSVGVAVLPPDAWRAEQWEQALARADQALYRAKAEGRDRVVLGELSGPAA